MKILFAGVLDPGFVNTTAMRAAVLESLGHRLRRLCLVPYLRWGGRWGGAPFRRLLWGPPLWLANRALLAAARDFRPDLVWIDKGPWIRAATLRRLRQAACRGGGAAHLVHYTPDAAFVCNRSRHFDRAVPAYDLVITNKRYELDAYRTRGAREVLLLPPGFDLEHHRPRRPSAPEADRYRSDVAFIGTYAPGRERYLAPLAALDLDLAIWGNGWRGCSDRRILSRFRGGPLTGDDYARGLSAARIGLGLLSPQVPDRCTTRSVEIPACGTFLLAERTGEHQALFREGVEAAFFGGEEELVEKVGHYLEHDAERRRIAEAGRRRCLESGYSYQHQLRSILQRLGGGQP